MHHKPKYTIAIVGRPNVGKSTLFNRLTGRWRAIVEDKPGITRDRLYANFAIFHHEFQIMDTGGLTLSAKTKIEKKMSAQAEQGIADADVILFLMDGREGVTSLDQAWVAKLRKIKKPKIYVVNKIDSTNLDPKVNDFHELNVDPLVVISAEKQRNFSGLSQAILKALDLPLTDAGKHTGLPIPDLNVGADPSVRPLEKATVPLAEMNIAIIGRPNVGKSTLLNAILDEERSIVDDVPGTTRDPIHTYFTHAGKDYCIIDTAGIRKRAKTVERVEKFSVVNALTVIDQAHMVLLVIDGALGPSDQDAHVAGYAFEKQKAIIVVVNKWDEGSTQFTREEFKEKLELKMNFLNYCPVIFISAKTRKNLDHVFKAIESLRVQYEMSVKTGELNRVFAHMIDHHPLPTYKSKDIKMFYATQVGVRPPCFMVFCSEPDHVHFTYKRYLINSLREQFALHEVPIRLLFRSHRKDKSA